MAHLNFKKICILLFIFSLFYFENNVQAQNWPSLFEPQDFMSSAKENNKENDKFVPSENDPEKVRKKLYNSFYFLFDFMSETRSERPRGWVDSIKEPQKALELGYPQVIKRPVNEVHFPVYPLVKLFYFKGDSLANSAINVCQTYWLQSLYQETYNCFASLQMNIENGTYPSTPLVKMQINLLQGFFLLNLLINNDKTIKNITYSTIPPTLIRFKPGEMLSLTNSIFYYVATRYNDNLFVPTKKSNDIIKSYGDFYYSPHYLIKSDFKVTKKHTVTLGEESLDALTWIRSVMPMVYINIMSLNSGSESQQRGFTIIDKLENYLSMFNFPKQDEGSALVTPKLSTVGEEIFLKPLNNLDALSMGDLYKALVLQKAQEPDTALKFIAKGILRNGDPDLASLLFKISGDAYFDLNILQLARRSYSWSEMNSKSFMDKVPSPLFFGAESAFWLGQYDVSKSGFKRFLLTSGDKDYAPRAMLRIANIEQLQGNIKNAQSMYEYIVRNLDKHQVSEDASVNLFCMNVSNLTDNVRKLKYKEIEKKIKYARSDVKRQAKACLMRSDLIEATKDSFKDIKKNVVEKANIQKEIINKYNKEFPDNEFIVLFADRIKQLPLSEAAFLAWQDKCKDLIHYYGKNKTQLRQLSKNNNKYVAGLEWGKSERKKLLRCSALVSDFKLWKEARNFDVGKEGNPIQDKFYILSTKPSAYTALEMYFALKKSATDWNNKLNKVENSGTEMTDREDFWELLALRKFLNYEFTASEATRSLLSHAIVKDIMKKPEMIFNLPIFCSWFLREFDKLNSSDFDAVAKIKSQADWLTLLLPSSKGSACETAVAKNLLSKSLKFPSDVRDKLILLPYLEKQGVSGASEDWLLYAQRLEQEKGTNDKNVVDIYRDLDKNAKDTYVKSAAAFWLKKNFPDNADKVLW